MKLIGLLLIGLTSSTVFADVQKGDMVIRRVLDYRFGTSHPQQISKHTVASGGISGYSVNAEILYPKKSKYKYTVDGSSASFGADENKRVMENCETYGGVRVALTINSKAVSSCKLTRFENGMPALDYYRADLPKDAVAKVVWYGSEGQIETVDEVIDFAFGK